MRKYLLLFVIVFCPIFLKAGGRFKKHIYYNYITISEQSMPLFLMNIDNSADKLGYFFLPLQTDYTAETKDIEFYRIIFYKDDRFIRFDDYTLTGIPFRSGDLIEKRDSVLVSEAGDTLSNYSLYVEITEFYTGTGLSINSTKKTKYKTNILVLDDHRQKTVLPKDFIKQGICQKYYPDGNIKEESVFSNGVISDGSFKLYHQNGTVFASYKIKNGLLQDSLIKYDNTGKIIESRIYKDGKLNKILVKTDKSNKNKKALIVAVGDYPVESGVSKVNSQNDVVYIENMLLDNGFPKNNINILIDEEATNDKIQTALLDFQQSVKTGDILYIQFSGQGRNDDFVAFNSTRDSISGTYSDLIETDLIFDFIEELRIRAGLSGQVVVTYDCGGSGGINNVENQNQESDTTQILPSGGFRSQVTDAYSNIRESFLSPLVIIYSAGFPCEIRVDNTSVGEISYYLSKSISDFPLFSFENLKDVMLHQFKSNLSRSFGINIIGNLDIPVFESQPWLNQPSTQSLQPRGNVWMLSVGIGEYHFPETSSGPSFTNCKSDAVALSDFFKFSFERMTVSSEDQFKFTNYTLIDSVATKEKIIESINYIISNAGPNDYFIFNFAGYTSRVCNSSGENETWFVPYGLSNIFDSTEIVKNSISLKQLKDLFQFIPANNQLFITEAGPSTDFQREFIKALIESNPTVSSISGKNRIILVPDRFGMDYFYCKNEKISHGPINYFITSLPSSRSIYQIFESGDLRNEIVQSLKQTEIECASFGSPYDIIFFEDEFVSDLKYYLTEDMQSRGAKMVYMSQETAEKKIGDKHALIIGTSNYFAAPLQWGKLANPVVDAKAIAAELSTNYGFEVKLLIDPPLDTVYKALISYSHVLDSTDQFLLFVAGHGDFDEILDDGMIVCCDSRYSTDDRARNSYIPYSKLTRIINKMPAKQIMVILDVCFGGTFDNDVARNKNRNSNNIYENISPDIYLLNKLKYNTRLYLTSGGKNEVPDGYKGKHSPFAYKILEALRGQGGSYGILTSSDLFQFVKQLPSEPLIGSFGDDEPGSEFVLIPIKKVTVQK